MMNKNFPTVIHVFTNHELKDNLELMGETRMRIHAEFFRQRSYRTSIIFDNEIGGVVGFAAIEQAVMLAFRIVGILGGLRLRLWF